MKDNEIESLLSRMVRADEAEAPPPDIERMRRLTRASRTVQALRSLAPTQFLLAVADGENRPVAAISILGRIPAAVIDQQTELTLMVDITQKPRIGAAGKLGLALFLGSPLFPAGAMYSVALLAIRKSGETETIKTRDIITVDREAVLSIPLDDPDLLHEWAALGRTAWQDLPLRLALYRVPETSSTPPARAA